MSMCQSNAAGIGFSSDGLCLEVRDSKLLSEEVLQKYFKHKNVSSFIRQLNNYGFKTIPVLLSSSVVHCFAHENFRRGRPDLLEGVTRRGTGSDEAKMGEALESLKQKDQELDQRLNHLRRMNDQLMRQNRDLADENKRLRSSWSVMQDTLMRCPPSTQQPQLHQQSLDFNRGQRMIHAGGPNAETLPQSQNGYMPHGEYPLAESVPFPGFPLFSDEM
jgi:hypothetical protein